VASALLLSMHLDRAASASGRRRLSLAVRA